MRLFDTVLGSSITEWVWIWDEISIQELVNRIIARTGSSSRIALPVAAFPMALPMRSVFEDMAGRAPDVTKIRALTEWRAERRLSRVLDNVTAEVRVEHEAPALTGDE